MRTDAIEDVRMAGDGEGETVGLGDAGPPDVAALGVALALYLFGSQRGMSEVGT
jgi:hypothetical protein